MLSTKLSPLKSYSLPLPTELISQILQSPRLSKSDLARCCLVNHEFLLLAQRQMYRAAYICLPKISTPAFPQWLFSPSSHLLFRTLEGNVGLRRHVRKLSMKASNIKTRDVPATLRLTSGSVSGVFRILIEMLPRLDSLKFDAETWQSVRSLVFSRRNQWKTVSISISTIFRQDQTWCDLPNLQELECHGFREKETMDISIPSSLQVLRINKNDPQILKGSPNSQLRILHVVGSPETLSNIGDFPELQHLHIFRGLECQPLLPSSAFSAFSQLSHLRSLSLALWSVGDPILSATLPSLLAHLPRSLDRLDFPERTPIEILSTYFQTSTFRPFRCLGYSRNKYQDETETIAQLVNLAFSKGVGLECL